MFCVVERTRSLMFFLGGPWYFFVLFSVFQMVHCSGCDRHHVVPLHYTDQGGETSLLLPAAVLVPRSPTNLAVPTTWHKRRRSRDGNKPNQKSMVLPFWSCNVMQILIDPLQYKVAVWLFGKTVRGFQQLGKPMQAQWQLIRNTYANEF